MQKRKLTLNRILFAMVCFAVVGMIETTCKKPDQGSAAPQKVPVEPTPRPEFAWLHDYNKAQEEAKANHKLLFLNFTGSDWCGWCIKLDKDIFSQEQFKNYAHDNLVLVELDFPRRKSQPTEERKQNMDLAQQYKVLGFPTIVVLNSSGQKVWQFDGYFPGGPEAFIEQLQKLPKS